MSFYFKTSRLNGPDSAILRIGWKDAGKKVFLILDNLGYPSQQTGENVSGRTAEQDRVVSELRLDFRNNGQPGLLIARLSLGPIIMIKNGKTCLFQPGLALVIFLVMAIAAALPAFAIAPWVGGKQNPTCP
jgi:hypothetical protein